MTSVVSFRSIEHMFDGVELERRVASLCGLLHSVTAELVSAIAEVLRTGAWEGAGIRSPEHWVAWRCGVSAGRARRLVAAARRLAELPATREAFEAGRLSEDQVAVVVRHAPASADASVAEMAVEATVPQLQRVLSSYRFEADGPEPARVEPERREVTFGPGDDGSWRLRAVLPADEGSLVERALEEARDRLFRERETPVCWADALLEMAGGQSPERVQVLLHVDADTPARDAHLHLGPAVPAGVRRYLSCDSTVRYVLHDDATPVSFGRARRTVPGPVRRLVEERDRGCVVPGCSQRRWLHVHHLVHHEDGGETVPSNLVCLCPFHHRQHHRGMLAIDGHPERLVFRDPATGRVLRPGPAHAPPAARPDGRPPYVHPSGERFDAGLVHFAEAG